MFGALGRAVGAIPGMKQIGRAVGAVPGMKAMNNAIPGGGMPGMNRPPQGIGPSPNAASMQNMAQGMAKMMPQQQQQLDQMPMKQFPPMMPQMGQQGPTPYGQRQTTDPSAPFYDPGVMGPMGGPIGPSPNGMQDMIARMRGRNTGFAGPRMQQPMMQPQIQQQQ
jgi:hypothetical protein